MTIRGTRARADPGYDGCQLQRLLRRGIVLFHARHLLWSCSLNERGIVVARNPRNDAKPVIPDAGLAVADYMAMMPVEPSSHDAGRGIVALYAAPVPTHK
jgi:hypothetical protein